MMDNHDLSGKKTNEENPEKKSNNMSQISDFMRDKFAITLL